MKRKYILLLLLTFSTISCFSQTEDKKIEKEMSPFYEDGIEDGIQILTFILVGLIIILY